MNNFHQQLKRILLIDCGDVTFSIFFKAYNIYLSKTHKNEEPEDIEGEIRKFIQKDLQRNLPNVRRKV